jgi:hypothetical protein
VFDDPITGQSCLPSKGTSGKCSAGECVKTPDCGDGIIDSNETCDDGNNNNDDSCVNCTLAKCGDGSEGSPRFPLTYRNVISNAVRDLKCRLSDEISPSGRNDRRTESVKSKIAKNTEKYSQSRKRGDDSGSTRLVGPAGDAGFTGDLSVGLSRHVNGCITSINAALFGYV